MKNGYTFGILNLGFDNNPLTQTGIVENAAGLDHLEALEVVGDPTRIDPVGTADVTVNVGRTGLQTNVAEVTGFLGLGSRHCLKKTIVRKKKNVDESQKQKKLKCFKKQQNNSEHG